MADEPWLLKEDGYLNVDPNLKQIIYHPSLNVILICTDLEIVHVLDVNSGVVLQSSRLSGKYPSHETAVPSPVYIVEYCVSVVFVLVSFFAAQENAKVICRYLTGQDRVLFCDGYGIGVRSDYNGVLLLDTILQKPVASPRNTIKLELLLSEVSVYPCATIHLCPAFVKHLFFKLKAFSTTCNRCNNSFLYSLFKCVIRYFFFYFPCLIFRIS